MAWLPTSVAPWLLAAMGLAVVFAFKGAYAQLVLALAIAFGIWVLWLPDLRPTLLTPSGRWMLAIDSARPDVHVLDCYVDQRGGHVRLANIGDTVVDAMLRVSPWEPAHDSNGPPRELPEQLAVAFDVPPGGEQVLNVGLTPSASSCAASVTNVQARGTSPALAAPTASPIDEPSE